MSAYPDFPDVPVTALPDDAVVATEVDAWLHLVTGRRAVMPTPLPEFTPCDRDSADFEALCRQKNIHVLNRVIVDGDSHETALTRLDEAQRRQCPLMLLPRTPPSS